MIKKIYKDDKFFIAGGSGMVGSSIKRILINNDYGVKENNGVILSPNIG